MSSHHSPPSVTLSYDDLLPLVARLLAEGHTVTIPLRGDSMRPFIVGDRDKALLTKVVDIKVNEPVVALLSTGHYVLHRVVRIEGDCVTLLGDGNVTPEHCSRTAVVAQVTGFYRKGRTTLDAVTGRKWKVYSVVWRALLPVRPILLAIINRLHLA